MNNHFNEASPSNGSGKKSAEGSVKLIRRNGKKLRYRRQPWSGELTPFINFFNVSLQCNLLGLKVR